MLSVTLLGKEFFNLFEENQRMKTLTKIGKKFW